VSQTMHVTLRPVLTYRARAFLPDRVDTPEGEFYHRVLEAEWTALVFARWCSDIPQLGIMWALPPRVRGNVREFGVPVLIGKGTYHQHDVDKLLREYDKNLWSSGPPIKRVLYFVSSPTFTCSGILLTVEFRFTIPFRPSGSSSIPLINENTQPPSDCQLREQNI
jgi:hypothetical protein